MMYPQSTPNGRINKLFDFSALSLSLSLFKRNLIPLLILTIVAFGKLSAQVEVDCIPEDAEPFYLEANACHIGEFSQEEIDALPVVTVWINVHYVNHNGYGNFVHKGPNNWDKDNGYKLAELIIQEANERFANLIVDATMISSNYFIGNGKIRFELYTEDDNEADLYGGIWYWENNPNEFQLPYGEKVLHYIIKAKHHTTTPTNFTGGGEACGSSGLCNRVYYFDTYFQVWHGNSPEWWSAGRNLCHEFGHTASLCHSFWQYNVCASEDDLNVLDECGNQSGTLWGWPSGCGANMSTTPAEHKCAWNLSKNMMGYNTSQTSLTRCQWNQMMSHIYNRSALHISFCDDLSPPIVIESNTQVIWDETKIMNRDVILEPLSELIIRCETRMGPGARILVNRGSRLIVEDGGSLVNLCADDKWRGIMVYGNNAIAHTPGMELDPLVADNPGIVIMNDAALRGAVNGISCNPPVPWPDLADYWNGIIKCVDTEFTNNKRSVEFMRTDVFNISSFTRCTFKNTDGSGNRGITKLAYKPCPGG